MSANGSGLVGVLWRHFSPALEMLETLIGTCPEDMWQHVEGDSPVWRHMYHAVFFVDYWLRDDYQGGEFRCLTFDRDVVPELDRACADSLSRAEMVGDARLVRDKAESFFARLDEEMLLAPLIPGRPYTYLDALLSQIRHIQHHVGRVNGVLARRGQKAVAWIAYNERRDGE